MKGVEIKEQMKSHLHLSSRNLGRRCSDSFVVLHDDGSRKMKIARNKKRGRMERPRKSLDFHQRCSEKIRFLSVSGAAPVGQDRREIQKSDHAICIGITST